MRKAQRCASPGGSPAELAATGRAALCGLGGIGKTQAAVEYAYEHEKRYDVIFWTAADSELALSAGFTDLARLLGLRQASDASQVRSAEAARQWLEAHPRWLLILDSVEHPEIVRKFRPQSAAGHLLLTSRRSNLDALDIVGPIELVRMNEAEAVEFLLARTGRTDEQHASERQAALLLARELGCLPLALEQAGAYLVANLARFEDYLRSYHLVEGRGTHDQSAHRTSRIVGADSTVGQALMLSRSARPRFSDSSAWCGTRVTPSRQAGLDREASRLRRAIARE